MAGAPVLILSAHRSGASVVAGLLARTSGLALGELMPSASAETPGSCESVSVAKAHNDVLDALDRDWTCPPSSLDVASLPTAGIAEAIGGLNACGTTWAVKDPRLLYLLPLWAGQLPAVRFVGVTRDHEAVVRSLQIAERLDPGTADVIARAYTRRLRVLRDRFDFPIVDFSASTDEVLRQSRAAATALGVPWNPAAASNVIEPSLVHDRSTGTLENPDVDRLRADARQPSRGAAVAAGELLAIFDSLAEPTDFDRYQGPRAVARRVTVWSAVPRDITNVVELTRNLNSGSALDPARGRGTAFDCQDLATMYTTLRKVNPRAGALVLPDVTSWISRGDIVPALTLVHDHLTVDGMVAIGLTRADAETQRAMGRDAINEEDIRTAAPNAGFIVLSCSGDDRLTVLRLVARVSARPMARSTREPANLPSTEQQHDRRPASDLDAVEQRLADSQAAEVRWRHQYERLRRRRSVRAALAISGLTTPLFRTVRRLRRARPG